MDRYDKEFQKRIGVLVLAVSVMFVGLVSPVYAAYDNYSDEGIEEYTVDEANDNTVIVESEDGDERLTVTEDDNTRKVTIYNVTTGEEEYLILNKVDGSIYSSITNKMVNIDEQAPRITPRSVTPYSTVYISWAEFKNTIGTTATVGGGTLVIPNDSNHGLKFGVKTVKYYRTRLGRRQVWKISKSITSVSHY